MPKAACPWSTGFKHPRNLGPSGCNGPICLPKNGTRNIYSANQKQQGHTCRPGVRSVSGLSTREGRKPARGGPRSTPQQLPRTSHWIVPIVRMRKLRLDTLLSRTPGTKLCSAELTVLQVYAETLGGGGGGTSAPWAF